MLLDTHMVLAILGQTELILHDDISELLQQPIDSFVSVVSIWEVAIKVRTGKLELSFDVISLPKILEEIGISILDITAQHTLAAVGPEPLTRDPFDRLLLGVCAVEGMKLLTIDKALQGHPLIWR